MKPTLLSVVIVGVLATISGVVAGLTAGEQSASPPIRPATTTFVPVPVAAHHIPVGSKLTTGYVNDYFVFKRFPQEAVPPDVIHTLDDLVGKRATRSLRAGELVRTDDVTAKEYIIDPPDGTEAVSLRIVLTQSATGFTLPGYKVMLMATKRSEKKGKEVVFPVVYDALILGADPTDTQGEVTLKVALTPEQTEMVELAVDGGATIQINLPQCGGWLARESDTHVFHLVPKSVEDVRAFLAGD